MTLGEWLAWAAERLADVESPRLEAQVLAAEALGKDRSWVLAHPEAPAPEHTGLERRVAGEPLAYILGWREFYGRRFSVSQAVLIPRQETEVLVEAVLARVGRSDRVLDLGCGSGCIGVTLALERPDLSVTLSDVSPDALEVARGNAQGATVEFVLSDLLDAVEGEFDWVVSNPPYVAPDDPLPADVRDHEPHLALFAGEDGLAIYRRIAETCRARNLALELGAGQSTAVARILEQRGWAVDPPIPDLAGIDRVLIARAGTPR